MFLIDEKLGVSHLIGSERLRVWVLLCSGLSVEEAVSRLAAETGSNPVVVLEDTSRFVSELIEADAIAEAGR